MNQIPVYEGWYRPSDESIFKCQGKKNGADFYRLQIDKISMEECHIFFPIIPQAKEFLLITALEYISFHPLTESSLNLYQLQQIEVGGIDFFWCHFPKEFRSACIRISELFQLSLTNQSRLIGEAKAIVSFPAHENLLFFAGGRTTLSKEEFDQRLREIVSLGNALQESSID